MTIPENHSHYSLALLTTTALVAVESRPAVAQRSRGAAPRRLRMAQLASTALIAAVGVPSASWAQNSGTPCVMIGQTCVIASTGGPATPASGDGGNGGPGNAGAPLSTTLIVPFDYKDDPATSTSPINMSSNGSAGAPGNENTGGANYGQGGSGGTGGAGGNLTLFVDSPSHGNDGTLITGTSGSIASGLTIDSVGGTGGGGALGHNNGGVPGTSASGGTGGAVNASIGGNFVSDVGRGADIWSQGGTGGQGATGNKTENKFGVDGGQGGNGGSVGQGSGLNLYGYFQGQTVGVHVSSIGGAGGQGGAGDSTGSGQGGNGGTGGNGGPVSVTVEQGAQIVGYSEDGQSAGLWVQSLGGTGGHGGGGELGGTGGQGGDAGPVSVTLNGQVTAAGGNGAPAVLAQSLGSVGGSGGHASDWTFNPTGGAGNTGGLANTVTVNGTGAMIQAGADTNGGNVSPGVLAQSIGGAGGIGADSTGIFAVGGSGGDGAAGSQVSINLTNSTIQSYGFGSAGLQAQSIGGGGGKGGDATSSGAHSGAAVNMVIGGTGGNGGAAADSNVVNNGGSITTTNQHSPGIVIQSIGGGGGDGGAAYGVSYSAFYGAAISVGGNGGGGGNGSTVNSANVTNNSGRILTIGSDSFGMLGQSIGGGGGNGGASTAKSIVKTPSGEGVNILSQSLAMASGGTGGNGGDADSVFLQNEGLIATQGAGAVGILAQAIGGGGGTGGDSSASSSASGGEWSLSASVSHGGSGGSGGHAGNVREENHGLVITTGESADGMLVQSIGGGGGTGGSGDAKSSTDSDKGLSLTMAMGGSGGGGGEGYNVSANNTGTIITLGDGARGMVEQTIGGGGGRGGGAAASTSGTIVTSVAIGGSGGDGGDTFYNGSSSQATNAGTILTFGADATGILAQSIGGGGGDGGKAGTTLGTSKSTGDGGNGGANNAAGNQIAQVAADFASNGTSALGNYITIQDALNTANSMLGNDSLSVSDDDDIGDDLDDTSASGGETEDDNNSKSISINVGIGGSGGSGGAAGFITVNNTGTVATMGRHADGIVAQAIGGGGGKGGGASTSSSDDISGNVSVGGSGGGSNKDNANNGGQPTVNNSGQIYTMGPLSNGIVAQSIAGGGGIGGSSTASSGGSSSGDSDEPSVALNISVGGGGGSGSISEQSQVISSGLIETRGHDSIGIVAQSISGGGGIVKTLATNLDTQGGSANASSTKDFAANIKIGNNSDSTSGNSGAVLVQTQKGGTITTMGDDSYGILAQSISGGGGVAQGGKPNGNSASDFFGTGKMTGTVNSGMDFAQNQGVQVEVGDAIQTSGRGGVGVFAQSIGGGGGISGDVGYTMQKVQMGRDDNHFGNGGDVQITVDQGASITTTGGPCVTGRSCGNAPGIIAQSIGGGGGWFTNTSYAYIGSAGGIGTGGNVTLNIQGSIDAQGPASPGVFAQSVGGSSNGGSGAPGQINITIGSADNTGVSVEGGNGFDDDAAGVRLDYGGLNTQASPANTLVNWGTIDSHENDPSKGTYNGTAIYGQGGYTIVSNYGTINGLIHLGSQEGSNTFTWGEVISTGTINSGSDISLGAGTLTNGGKLNIGGSGHIATTQLLGNFVQTPTGRLVVDTNHTAGTSDLLDVQGHARVGGTVEVHAASLANSPVTVLSATDGLTVDPNLEASRTYLYRFDTRQSGNSLQVQPAAEFSTAAGALGRNQRRVAAHLQELWDKGATLDEGFTALAAINDGKGYARALNSLSGQTVGAIAAFRYSSSNSFVSNMLDECTTFEGAGVTQDEASCTWARAFGGVADQDRTTDALGYHTSAWTLQAGGQREVAPGWLLGGSIGYESSSFRGDNGSSRVSGDSLLLGATLRYQTGPWQASGALDFGYGWYDSKRAVEAGTFQATADASPNLWHVGAHARLAYQAPIDAWYVQPRLDLHLTYVHGNAYTETGAGPFDLSVESEGAATFSAIPAVEVGGRIPIGETMVLRPFASAGVELDANSDWAAKARFADQPGSQGFRATTPIPDVLGKFSVGAEVLNSANWDVRLQYDSEIGDGYSSSAGSGRLTYRF